MRGEVYPGIYLLDNAGAHRMFPVETVLKADACVEEWSSRTDKDQLTLTGNGLLKYRERFECAGFSTEKTADMRVTAAVRGYFFAETEVLSA